jgi:uncharacterized protein (TIGR02145 family)
MNSQQSHFVQLRFVFQNNRITKLLMVLLFANSSCFAQITKPGYQAPTKKAAPVYNGPKKFTGKSKIIVEIDMTGTLKVDYQKIWDFTKGEVWMSDIAAGQHRIELTDGTDTWKTTVETKSGQQLIVVTELQNTISARQAEAAREAEAARKADASLKSGTALFTDNRDGQSYRMIKIGDQVWMSENLNYNSADSWCYDCEKYGRLYTWSAAKKGCPTGWHLPSDAEWSTIVNNNGGEKKAGANLQEGGSSGFNASLGGYRSTDGEFGYVGEGGGYWSSSASGEIYAWMRNFLSGYDEVVRSNEFNREIGQSVRCLQD